MRGRHAQPVVIAMDQNAHEEETVPDPSVSTGAIVTGHFAIVEARVGDYSASTLIPPPSSSFSLKSWRAPEPRPKSLGANRSMFSGIRRLNLFHLVPSRNKLLKAVLTRL